MSSNDVEITSEDVFEGREFVRKGIIFVPRGKLNLSLDNDIAAYLTNLEGSPEEQFDVVYFSLRSEKSDLDERKLAKTKRYCDALGIKLVGSHSHDDLLNDVVLREGAEALNIGYVARFREKDIDTLIEKMRESEIEARTVGVG